MNRNETNVSLLAISGLTPTEHRRLRETFCSIGEACPVQPRTFTDNRNPRSVHRAYLGAMPQYLKAVEAAGTRAAERAAVERACTHMDEQKAILRARVTAVELPFPDARRNAQVADSAEDVAQERYACEPTRTNAEAWSDEIRAGHAADETLLTWLRAKFAGSGERRVVW